MDNIYLVMVLILGVLAVADLVVGVANDAANFLNSAVGCKVASRRVILWAASIGIFIGTFFGTGMMEIARQGVFHPNMFHFHDIMVLFLAVMIADVIMLDMFNAMGLTTSTTVSLLFELLGAAVAVGLFVIYKDPNATSLVLSDYINSAKAFGFMSAILSSIIISLVCGTLLMYVSRLLFTFNYEKNFKWLGALWCGLSFTAVAYFAIYKVLKSISLVSPETLKYLQSNSAYICLVVMAASTALYALMQHLFKINILRVAILLGTASLALAFAGSDLVNFIGVPMAAYHSYEMAGAAQAAGTDLATFTMDGLKAPVQADWRILVGAGFIMVLTLFFSKKARKVIDTGVNLARQNSGVEQFGSMQLSRGLVRGSVNFHKAVERITPKRVRDFIDSRFKPLELAQDEKISFDYIRASVNLTVATMLISLATSLKIPLSTTYVTFMVAMGSSLADRAWGRDSAVYRITGVITVVTGWFFTALIAFTTAGLVACALMFATKSSVPFVGMAVVIGLGSIAILRLLTSKEFRNRKKEAEEAVEELVGDKAVHEYGYREIKKSITQFNDLYKRTLSALFREDRNELREIADEAENVFNRAKNKRKYEVLPNIERMGTRNPHLSFYYIQVVDYNFEVAKSLRIITRESYEYIDNAHEGFSKEQIKDLRQILHTVNAIYSDFTAMLDSRDYSRFDELFLKRETLDEVYFKTTEHQMERVKENVNGMRNTILFLNIISETRTLILQSRNLMKSQRKLALADPGLQLPG